MRSIRDALAESAAIHGERWIWGSAASVALADPGAADGWFGAAAAADRSVVVATRDQLSAACALIALDGCARRLLLCPPDVTADQLGPLAARAGADLVVTDDRRPTGLGVPHVRCPDVSNARLPRRRTACDSEWLLLTSGTAGLPKMVRHTFSTLSGAIPAGGFDGVWGTFYDVRRYGGLQVLLRVLVGGGSFVIGDPDETIAEYLTRLAARGVTHISGTPSHWRRVLMSPRAGAIAPRYIRLSGEIADQGVLDAVRARYPGARIVHAFASTEAGVGFEVDDGLEGFPAAMVDAAAGVGIRVDDGALRLRSARAALGYVDASDGPLADAAGFVDTGDAVERRGDRYYFLGRSNGVINIGGLKVHPEEVEAAINRHPRVRMSKVRPKPNSITGSLVAADVVLQDTADAAGSTREILTMCRAALPPHKVPAVIRIVDALDVALTGKLVRHGA